MIDNQIEEIPFGNFLIEKPDNVEVIEKTSFIGYDYMQKFNVPYIDNNEYPITLKEYLRKLCELVGVELGTDVDTLPNKNYEIKGNPFTNNEDCKTVLSNVCQLCGGFAKIGRDNKLYIKSLKNISDLLKVRDVHAITVKELNLIPIKLLSNNLSAADETLDGNNYFTDFSKNEEWGEVNSLVLRLSQIEGENSERHNSDSIEEYGLTEIVIEDNYFLIDEIERELVIDNIWNTLKGIKYLPFKTDYYGYPYLDSGDIIYVLDSNDNEYISYVFNHTFKFNGAFSGTLETPAMTKVQTAYKNINNAKTRFRNVEYKVDKINGEISTIVEEQQEIKGNLASQSIENNNNYQEIIGKLEDVPKKDDIVTLKNSVETLETSTKYAIEISEDIQVNGVSKVKTETGYTFDDEGLKIEKTGAKTKSVFNEKGMDIKDATGSSEESLLFAGYNENLGETIVKSKNMAVQKYLTIGKYSRIEDYDEGTGVFWIGG